MAVAASLRGWLLDLSIENRSKGIMTLTGLETTLIGALVGVAGLSIGIISTTRSKVSKDFCKFQHDSMERLWDEKLKPINEKLDALIEGHGWDGKDRRKHGG